MIIDGGLRAADEAARKRSAAARKRKRMREAPDAFVLLCASHGDAVAHREAVRRQIA